MTQYLAAGWLLSGAVTWIWLLRRVEWVSVFHLVSFFPFLILGPITPLVLWAENFLEKNHERREEERKIDGIR